jgi:hypothetical protein
MSDIAAALGLPLLWRRRSRSEYPPPQERRTMG